MTQRKALLLGLSLLASSQAWAADNRLRTIPYDEEAIVSIVGHSGIQSTIQFGRDERIENVAVGDSSAWQVTPNRRGTVLFVKPLAPTSLTNMTVVTDKRTYMFDLSTGRKAGPPLYALKFSYPDLPPASVAPVEPTAVVMASASGPAMSAVYPERLNFDWKMKGHSKLRPERLFDDGVSLYLSWREDLQLPAILTVAEKGREAPLDYRVAGEYIVVTPIPSNIVLRYGNKAAAAWTSRRPTAAPAPTVRPPSMPVRQSPETIASATKFASTSASTSPGPQLQPALGIEALASTQGIKRPIAADLLTDNLTDSNHDN